MHKHTVGNQCLACDEKLQTAHPYLVDWFSRVKIRNPSAHVSWAWRDERAQNRFHAEGKSNVAWPLSNHNKLDDQGNPCSLALDLFEIASNGMACWSWKYFKNIADESKANGDLIVWGGDFKKFPDGPHFEINEEVKRT